MYKILIPIPGTSNREKPFGQRIYESLLRIIKQSPGASPSLEHSLESILVS